MKHPQAMDVINDSFGNYVAQRLVQRADVAQRMTISDTLLKPAMLELSGHQYGCRVIQAAIEVGHPSLSFCASRSPRNTARSAHVLLLCLKTISSVTSTRHCAPLLRLVSHVPLGRANQLDLMHGHQKPSCLQSLTGVPVCAAPADHQGQVRAGGPAEGAGAQVCARLARQPRRAVLLPAHPRQGGRRQHRLHAGGERCSRCACQLLGWDSVVHPESGTYMLVPRCNVLTGHILRRSCPRQPSACLRRASSPCARSGRRQASSLWRSTCTAAASCSASWRAAACPAGRPRSAMRRVLPSPCVMSWRGWHQMHQPI